MQRCTVARQPHLCPRSFEGCLRSFRCWPGKLMRSTFEEGYGRECGGRVFGTPGPARDVSVGWLSPPLHFLHECSVDHRPAPPRPLDGVRAHHVGHRAQQQHTASERPGLMCYSWSRARAIHTTCDPCRSGACTTSVGGVVTTTSPRVPPGSDGQLKMRTPSARGMPGSVPHVHPRRGYPARHRGFHRVQPIG